MFDLFAGPGKYKDGSKSTPIHIIEGTVRDKEIRDMLLTIFNDSNPENCLQLQQEIKNIEDVELLKYKPQITNHKVNDELAEKVDKLKYIPTLYFLDPWGYKGLSLQLIKATLQGWGCDCMFFLNYNRINAALSNPVMTENMNAFFGTERADKLRTEIANKSPKERESLIIKSLKEALGEFGGKHTIEYFFKDDDGEKTSHFLILVSKNPLAYKIMKDIMAGESSDIKEGVANLGFNPKDKEKQPGLFDSFYSPINDLAKDLMKSFAGETLSARDIFHKHSIGKNFIFKNYQDALRKLEERGKVTTNPDANNRRKVEGIVTFGENVTVSFPNK
jgi:three-Cys-motif partner protein